MSKTATQPWLDRFKQPTAAALLAELPAQKLGLFETVREKLPETTDAVETLGWHGIPWRWCFAYEVGKKRKGSDELPFAYLIPDPERPRLCLPLEGSVVATVKPRQISKTIREGIVYATRVADVFWTTWDLQSKAGLEDILSLVRFKHEVLFPN